MVIPRAKFVPYRDRPYCFFDFETTHTEVGRAEVTEAGFIHDVKGKWSVRIMPEHLELADPEALAVGNFNEQDWTGAPKLTEIWNEMCEWMEDVILVGHNASGFDRPILIGEARKKGLDTSRISRSVIDTQVLALHHLVKRGLNRLSLEACCNYYDISNEGAHFALEDAMRCKMFFNRLTNRQEEMF